MAKYRITALNQINVGARRTFFNFDSKLSYDLPIPAYLLSTEDGWRKYNTNSKQISGDIRTESEYTVLSTNYICREHDNRLPISEENNKKSIILDEHQDVIEALDPQNGDIIRLFMSHNTNELYEKMRKFNKNTNSFGNIYFSEYGSEETQKKNLFQVSSEHDYTSFCPMYDIMDVSIKSSTNGFVPVNTKIDSEDDFQNVFAPDLKTKPLGFCQINNGKLVYTYMMTDRTENDPYMYSSQLKSQRLTNTKMSYYEMLLESERTNNLTYRTPQELGKNSYVEFIGSNGEILSVFEPIRNFRGVDRNYILNFPDSEISSEYDTGNVHAEIIPGKNPLNAMYSMQMSSVNSIQNSRRYCGISQCGNRPYLKFYDSVDYKCTSNGTDTMDCISMRSEHEKLPYQKVEFFNKNTFTNKCKHKSNLFSVKIEDLDDLSQNTVQDEENGISRIDYNPSDNERSAHAVRRIREDLYSAVKQIVENVCPVNTQLFKVYFGNG